MDLVQAIKISSSQWFKQQRDGDPDFYWQDGYAAISVTPQDSPKLVQYILNQKQHHETVGYQEECREYFKRQGLEFDERYFWD